MSTPEVAQGRVTGLLLRLLLLALAAGAAAVAMAGVPDIGVWSVLGVMMIALVIGTASAPGTVVPLLFLLGLVAYRLMAHGAVPDLGLAALVALMLAVHQLSGICSGIPPRARLGLDVVRPAAIRWCVAVVPVELGLAVLALVR
jgi:hypothetical protein